MIFDVTGAVLIPGDKGQYCPGNGKNDVIECCCDECDYYLCCTEEHDPAECYVCGDKECPHSQYFKRI